MEEMRNDEAPVTPPAAAESEPPQMSEIGTVMNVFLEPGEVFQDLKRKPRFIIAGVIIALLFAAYAFGLAYKVGEAQVRQMIVRELDKNAQVASMPADQKAGMVEMQMTIQRVIRYVMPVFVFISFFIGGLLYFLGSKAFGGTGRFMHAVSVWVYSSLPPTVVAMIANFIVMAFKRGDEIDLAASQRGVLQANLGFLLDGKAQPVLTTIVSTFDLFAIWGWILAAIGLRITNRLSTGSAWGVVIIFALIGVLMRVIGSYFSGNPS